MEEIQNEARYHRERFDLYKAKIHGPQPTSLQRLRELERRHRGADTRLRSATQENALESAGGPLFDAGGPLDPAEPRFDDQLA